MKNGLQLFKALLVVVSLALKAVAGLSIPAYGIASERDKAWDEILSSTVEGAAEASMHAACSAVEERLDEASAIADSMDQTAPANGQGIGGPSNVSSKPCLIGTWRRGVLRYLIAVYSRLARMLELREHASTAVAPPCRNKLSSGAVNPALGRETRCIAEQLGVINSL